MRGDFLLEREVRELKRKQLEDLSRHREYLRKNPRLRWLFFELTSACNLHCSHCGSSCTPKGEALTREEIGRVLCSLGPERPMVCLTGGEPLLHPQLFEIGQDVKRLGLDWGMTSNGTLTDEACALRLREAGMATISVSLDGLEASHDRLRGKKGAFRRTLGGLMALKKAGFHPQVTSVLYRDNLEELEPLYRLLCELGIDQWRPINIEPIGRACESGDLLLRPKEIAQVLSFIRDKRFDPDCRMEVTFGCSHYLGLGYERMVRDHYFLCGAGILTASVRSNGDICACLDVPNRPELVQGNIKEDDFAKVWRQGFQVFRRDRTLDSDRCSHCPERILCGGDSTHTWDFARQAPLLCYRDFGTFLEKTMEEEKEARDGNGI